jgi:hypothetical protein
VAGRRQRDGVVAGPRHVGAVPEGIEHAQHDELPHAVLLDDQDSSHVDLVGGAR